MPQGFEVLVAKLECSAQQVPGETAMFYCRSFQPPKFYGEARVSCTVGVFSRTTPAVVPLQPSSKVRVLHGGYHRRAEGGGDLAPRRTAGCINFEDLDRN